jgi:putative transport protein
MVASVPPHRPSWSAGRAGVGIGDPMDWLIESLRRYPELAIFSTLAVGHWVGRLQWGRFSLGPVTGVLLAGVLVGQAQIAVSPHVKAVFFLMFLFAVGYGVGPQFVRGLKTDGVPQAAFAFLQCLVSLVTVYGIALFLGYDAGTAAGLLSGSQTISTVLGVATDTIGQLELPEVRKDLLIGRIPVAYAVTYVFGTAGSAWLLANLGPRLLGIDLAAECRTLEATLGAAESVPGVTSAARRVDARAFRVTGAGCVNRSVADIEDAWKDSRAVIERIRRCGAVLEAEPTTIVERDDVVAVVGRRETLVETDLGLGPEVQDFELLDFPAEAVEVVVTNKTIAGNTLREIAESDIGRADVRGVYLTGLLRGGEEMPFTPGTVIDRGDVLRIVGAKRNVERAATKLGYADRPTNATDLVFVGLGIALGGLLGSLTIKVGGAPLSLTANGGALIAGLLFGWLRSVHRTFGRVPAPALWILNQLGLTAFIAVVGISAGPSFVAGVRELGLSLFLAGVVATSLPLVVGVLLGRYVFRFHPAVTLGAAAGAMTLTAALPMLEEVARSRAPALGYTVPFAVSMIVLTTWGLAIVLLVGG